MTKESNNENQDSQLLPFIQILTEHGCGNHMLIDLLSGTSCVRISDRVDSFVQALVLSRRNPDIPFPRPKFLGRRVLDVINEHYRMQGIEPGDSPLSTESAAGWMAHILSEAKGKRPVFLHNTALIHSIEQETPDGKVLFWSAKDRDEARILLEELLLLCGYRIHKVAVIRNPLDIYLSQRERDRYFYKSGALKQQVYEFFELISQEQESNNIFVARYEDICSNADGVLNRLLTEIGLSEAEIANVDSSIPHSGEIAKWRAYPPDQTAQLAELFAPFLKAYNYEYKKFGQLEWRRQRIRIAKRKLAAEFSTINRIVWGDSMRSGAFVRHKRSLIASLYFRLVCLLPFVRRKVDDWYLANNLENPIRPLTHRFLKKIPFDK